jgi:hypothetical protein
MTNPFPSTSARITCSENAKDILTFSGSAPTAEDILLEGKKTLITSMKPADESGAYMQLSGNDALWHDT